MLYDIVRVHGVHRLDLSHHFLKINFNRWWILDCKTKKYWKISLDIYILSSWLRHSCDIFQYFLQATTIIYYLDNKCNL